MGTPVNYFKKYSFVVEIDGVGRAAFTTCSEMAINVDTVEHREGGRLHPHKAPGLVNFPPVTLEHGIAEDLDLYNWIKDTADAASNTGQKTPDLYRTLEVVQLDRTGGEVERYVCYDCWAKEYKAGDWDNNASEVRMESLVFECDYWERLTA